MRAKKNRLGNVRMHLSVHVLAPELQIEIAHHPQRRLQVLRGTCDGFDEFLSINRRLTLLVA